MSTAKELFLSYGREPEVVPFVTQLKRDLESRGFSVWLDAKDMPAGCDWHAAIGTGLDNCKALIAIISNKYITSQYCMSELYTANGDQKLIFPVIIENVDFSATERSRGVKYVVSGINWTMFRSGYDDYQTSLEKLVSGMKEQGLGKDTEATDFGIDTVAGNMSQLHLSPSTDPNSTPSPSAPNPMTLPANPGYLIPHTMYNPSQNPPPSSPYHYHQGYMGYPPSSHVQPPIGSVPYSPYYTSPPNGYGQPMPYSTQSQQYPGSPHSPYYPPPSQSPSQPYPYATPPPGTVYPGAVSPPQVYPGAVSPPRVYPGAVLPPQVYPGTTPPGAVPPHGQRPIPDSRVGNEEVTPPLYGTLFPESSVTTDTNLPSEASDVSAVSSTKSNFKVGMKLEAVDRRFPYFVCVATVMDRKNDDVLVHFDGWGPQYNYWCSRNSVELHPSGWCEKNNWELQKPLNLEWEGWSSYLSKTQSDAAMEELFSENQLVGAESLLFTAEMRLEAKDQMNVSQYCVATIKDIRDKNVLVHFDGWGNEYDHWYEARSTDLHPAMWCGKNGRQVVPPKGYKSHFKWSEYLTNNKINPAPAHVFTEEQLSADGNRKSVKASNVTLEGFQVGMKLEARDRLLGSLVCVATISDIKDDQLLIHFDGWSTKYDYWCKPTSGDIHPKGWCESNGRNIQAPQGFLGNFNWNSYLSTTSSAAAMDKLFTKDQRATQQASVQMFKVGMKLEAKDRLHPSLTCVATIIDIKDGQLLINFDGWGTKYDYWCEPDSLDIHPVGWCQENGRGLQAPKGTSGKFNWTKYLRQESAVAAPNQLFLQVKPHSRPKFKVGMRLEAKDRLNLSLTCVSTITDIKKNGQLLIHFDGWSNSYDYWCEPDSPDIHPVGWCQVYSMNLQPPHGYPSSFNWNVYLQETNADAAPDSVFTPKQKQH